jgi:hypothetical protein
MRAASIFTNLTFNQRVEAYERQMDQKGFVDRGKHESSRSGEEREDDSSADSQYPHRLGRLDKEFFAKPRRSSAALAHPGGRLGPVGRGLESQASRPRVDSWPS